MKPFVLYNPTQLLFGKGMTSKIGAFVPAKAKVLLVYGGGSVKKNGSYDQTVAALGKRKVVEFSGIEPNPEYDTCMKAVETIKKNKIDFILALGGGSVLDACKFIAAAAVFKGKDPWKILSTHGAVVESAMPVGAVLTIPATGSEMNPNSVVSRRSMGKKLAFASDAVYPKFSVLDPTFTFTLPERQTSNGVVDAFVHVMEQYCTKPSDAPIQDRFAEGIISTLIENGPKALKSPEDFAVRSNIMFAATMALNKLIGMGVPQDWSSHMIGHEITALYGLDHAQTLAIVLPKVLKFKRAAKGDKIAQLGARVFGIKEKSKKAAIDKTVAAIVTFFKKMKMKTELCEYAIGADAAKKIAESFASNNGAVGEDGDISQKEVEKILSL